MSRDYLAQALALLPRGPLWSRGDGPLGRLLHGLTDEFGRVEDAALGLLLEAIPSTATEGGLLAEWEELVGITKYQACPKPSTLEGRRALVRSRLIDRRGHSLSAYQTIADVYPTTVIKVGKPDGIDDTSADWYTDAQWPFVWRLITTSADYLALECEILRRYQIHTVPMVVCTSPAEELLTWNSEADGQTWNTGKWANALAVAIAAGADLTGEASADGGAEGELSLSLEGVAEAYGGAVGELTSSGLLVLAFDEPAVAHDFSSEYATDEWLLQETSGGYANNVGSETLANNSGLQGQAAVGLWDGTDYVSRNAWESTSDSHWLESSGTDAGDSDDEDFSVRVVFRLLDGGNAKYLLSKITGSSTAGWAIRHNLAGTLNIRMYDGTNSLSQNGSVNTYADGAPHYLAIWYDESADRCYVKTDLEEFDFSTAAITGSLTSADPLRVNQGALGSSGCPSVQYGHVGVSVGANAQAMFDEDFWQVGADPTGELTTATRDSTIGVPVAPGYVGWFGVDQLPIGYAELLSNANKLGLFANSALVNIHTRSDDVSSWSFASNATAGTAADDTPDGFNGAQTITASADNGYIRHALSGEAPSTTYTFSIYVRRNGGSDVSGKIRLQDGSAATETDQSFVATDTWQRITVTHTMGASPPAGWAYVYVDTNGESIQVANACCLAGTWGEWAPCIRTDGSAVTITVPDYRAEGSAGEFCKGAAGEIEAVYLVAADPTQSADPYVLDLIPASGNDNRRIIFMDSNGDQVRTLLYDSAGSSKTLNQFQDTDAVENVTIMQWAADGGLTGDAGACLIQTYNGGSLLSDVDTYTGTDTVTDAIVGNNGAGSQPLDGWIASIEIFDGERE